jgi:hypothetical protein
LISASDKHNGRSGVSLAETAIVLLVAGLTLGGLWAAVAMSRENARRDQAAATIVAVVKNVRALYQSKFDATDMDTASLLAAGAIPADMKASSGSEALNPWGGAFVVEEDSDPKKFIVDMDGLNNESCAAMGAKIGVTITVDGLDNITINDGAWTGKPPVSVKEATEACKAGDNNAIKYTFQLRKPNS